MSLIVQVGGIAKTRRVIRGRGRCSAVMILCALAFKYWFDLMNGGT